MAGFGQARRIHLCLAGDGLTLDSASGPDSCAQTGYVVDLVDEVNKKTNPLTGKVHCVQKVHDVQKIERRIQF
mgnify:CR=1 FL=1